MKKNTDNLEEKLNEALSQKGNSFSVPDGYFDKLPESIMDKINALPDFDKSAVTNPFSVPDNYFEKLSLAISERVTETKSIQFSWLNIFNRPRFIIPAAFATIVILAGLYYAKLNRQTDPIKQEITAEDLKNSTYIEYIDDDLFVDAISEQGINSSDESIEQYLIDNNIDLSQIENNL